MSTSKKIERDFGKRLNKYQPKIAYWVGSIGDADGNVYPYANNTTIVNVRDLNGGLHRVLNQHVPVRIGLLVKVGYEATTPDREQILSPWDVYKDLSVLQVIEHTHDTGDDNTDFVRGERILPFLVTPNEDAAFSVDIYPGVDRINDVVIFSGFTTIDLSSYVPAAGALFVNIYQDDTGAFSVVAGTAVDTPELLSGTDVPQEPIGTVTRSWIRLFSGQENIRQEPDYTDIFDPRWALGFAPPAASLRLFLIDPALAPADGEQLLWNDAAQQWETGTPPGGGDMLQSVYDTDSDNVVDNSASTQALQGVPLDPAMAPNDGDILTYEAASGLLKAKVPASNAAPDYILLRNEQAARTNGGTFTAGAWRTRVINTEVLDAGGHCSLATNQITLAAGTYRCRIEAPAYFCNRHKAILYNISDSAMELVGTTEYSGRGADATMSTSKILGEFTIATSKIFEVRHYGEVTEATYGFGVASNMSMIEIYVVAEFWKVG